MPEMRDHETEYARLQAKDIDRLEKEVEVLEAENAELKARLDAVLRVTYDKEFADNRVTPTPIVRHYAEGGRGPYRPEDNDE